MSEVQSNWLPDHSAVGATCKHKSWDNFPVASVAERRLEGAGNYKEHAHHFPMSTMESGTWLRALPVTTPGHRRIIGV